jgi:Heterokaryon incompatibility protein (HET)
MLFSHTWGADGENVTYEDLMTSTGQKKPGYKDFSTTHAARDRLQNFWVDTCCINKRSNTELTTAINSMFSWLPKRV